VKFWSEKAQGKRLPGGGIGVAESMTLEWILKEEDRDRMWTEFN
jgi:hypothetical protein